MTLLNFYRFYASLFAGILVYMLLGRSLWLAAGCVVAFRLLWLLAERLVGRFLVDAYFKRHIHEFKQQLGPYGIRMANKAENDRRVKKSLAEVFVPSLKKLQKNYEYLKVLDTLYGAGMRPDRDSLHLNDCKLKYAAFRLERQGNVADQ